MNKLITEARTHPLILAAIIIFGGGSFGHDVITGNGNAKIEERLAAIENRLTHMDETVTEIESDLDEITDRIGAVEQRIVRIETVIELFHGPAQALRD